MEYKKKIPMKCDQVMDILNRDAQMPSTARTDVGCSDCANEVSRQTGEVWLKVPSNLEVVNKQEKPGFVTFQGILLFLRWKQNLKKERIDKL